MKPYLLPVLVVFPLLFISCSGSDSRYAPQTLLAERQAFKHRLIHETIDGSLSKPLTIATEGKWEDAFWGMVLSRYTSAVTDGAVAGAFKHVGERSVSFRRAFCEAVYTVYPDRFVPEMGDLLRSTSEEKTFAMAALYVARKEGSAKIPELRGILHQRFPNWASHPILLMLDADLDRRAKPAPYFHPPLIDLLAYRGAEDAVIVFSLQRRDRSFPGMLVVRDTSGRFVRDHDGDIFHIPQLALAASNLPGYITNGNTPEGVLSFITFERTKNAFIGPTEAIILVLPYEVPPAVFFKSNDLKDSAWSIALYDRLLPPSWRDDVPIHEAFYAGKAGRNEILSHGTATDPEFYRGEACYPNTPSLGCLTAYESWSLETGRLVSSDQERLLSVLKPMNPVHLYYLVVNIDDEAAPVEWPQIRQLVSAAEEKLNLTATIR